MARLVDWITGQVALYPKGNCLRLDRFRELGAPREILERWASGWSINETFDEPSTVRNHPSLAQHAERVHKEWARMEKLGKIRFFESGHPKPELLHVNPCAAILKDRPDCDPSWPEDRRTKLRIIVDPLRSGVNAHVCDEGVNFSQNKRLPA